MAALDYLDFDLEIEASATPGSYEVSVLASPRGEASGEMTFPLNPDALENVILKLGRTRSGVRAIGSPTQQVAKQFGSTLYDALFDMLGAETYQKYLERGNIEVAPLAYMRGRTLDDSFIILDEAQNTSREQMKMFLTRMGFGSKIVITGDITQIDLPGDKPSGLKEAMKVLKGVEGVSICQLGKADVVRHVMVQRIIEAYDRNDKAREKKQELELAEQPD